MAKSKQLLVFHQTGNRFYSFKGMCLFTAKTKVKDYDLSAAEQAQKEFLIWADNRGFRPQQEIM